MKALAASKLTVKLSLLLILDGHGQSLENKACHLFIIKCKYGIFKEGNLPMAFSSDFSASVALCCISVVVSAPFESMLLAHADFANSGSEDFWDNLS